MTNTYRRCSACFRDWFWLWIAGGLVLAYVLHQCITPRITVLKATQGDVELPHTMPIITSNVQSGVTVTIRIERYSWEPSTFRVIPDDCLTMFVLSDETMVKKDCAPGAADRPFVIDIGASTQGTIVADIRNGRGSPMGIDIRVEDASPLSFALNALLLTILVMCVIRFGRRFITTDTMVLALLASGIAVRMVYGMNTPFAERAHDAGAHLEYVMLMADHWTLPPAKGWEFHQPPLYYAVSSLIVRGVWMTGLSGGITFWVQMASILYACCTLIAAVWIGRLLLRDNTRAFRTFTAFVAGLPGLVFFSSWISNDTLVCLEIFIAGGLLVVWWRGGSKKVWYALWILAGIAFLTKLNGLSIAVALMLLGILSHRSRRPDARMWIIGLGIFVLLTAWLPIARMAQDSSDIRNLVMTGKSTMPLGLKVNRSPADFLIFNPVAMVARPLNNPYLPQARRSNPYEYFFRSALFGEFSNLPVPWLARGVLILGLALVGWILMGAGLLRIHREDPVFPFIVLSLTTLLLWLAYILIFPFAPEQDFRFSPFLAATGAYLLASGIHRSSERWQKNGEFLVICFSVLSMLMLIV